MRHLVALTVVLVPTVAAAATQYELRWTGHVRSLRHDLLRTTEPAQIPGVNVGDVMVASFTYDPLAFSAGVEKAGIGRDYAPLAAGQLHYSFSSGATFSRDISSVSAFDYTFDQFNINSPQQGGLLFQANDWASATFSAVPPASFAAMHEGLLSTYTLLEPSSGNHLQVGDVVMDFTDQVFTITPVPEPATLSLLALGGMALLRRRRHAPRKSLLGQQL